ncbi:MAG: hypothetical protein KA028_00815 [Candidatus Pacebacteria bacterium]|nr:hypothetical protein [Candidatus Paceibacterota bacterium]
MIYKPKTVEEHVLALLQKGSLGTADMLAKVQAARIGTTKQALYQTLHKLKKEEVVVMRSKQVSLSHIWIKKMAEYFAIAERSYGTHEQPGEDFLLLKDGDKISYTFKDPTQTDMFLGHAFGVLAEVTSKDEPIYLYNPHEWFFLARHETERYLFDKLIANKKQLYLIAGNRDPLDVYVAKEFNNDLSQYYASSTPLFEKGNYYFNIYGDYIMEFWIDEATSEEIDLFYKNTTVFDEAAEKKIKGIIERSGRNKVSISKNARKAEKLKKIFAKYFLIKKGL